MHKPLWVWALFLGIVVLLLLLDLGVIHRKQRIISIKESLWMSAFYVSVGLLFGVWVWHHLGKQSGEEYITGFLIEKSLALDNIFLISVIFSAFHIPRQYQHRVLFWGIIGVIFLRALLIFLGATLVERFSWILYLFSGFLIYTGIKMLRTMDKPINLKKHPVLIWVKRHLPITAELRGQQFYVIETDRHTGNKRILLTPLLAALVSIECLDLLFAVDSVPAIFAVTTDPYIVYTSNIFAILGLRALYFALAAIIDRFYYLKYALAYVLIFIGSKIFIAYFLDLEKFPTSLSLAITFGLLALGIVYSLYRTQPKHR